MDASSCARNGPARQCAVPRRRLATLGGIALVIQSLAGAPALAGDEPPAFFDPLVTISPGITREVDVLFDHARGAGGRLTQPSLRLQYPVLPWLQWSLEAPVVVWDPDGDASRVGMGDLLLSGQARVWVPRAWPAEIDVGFELTLPSGSSDVLAGSTAVRPFAIAGTKLGPLDLIGNVSYHWMTAGPFAGTERLQVVFAAGYPAGRIAPFTELVLVKPVRGEDDLRPQVSLVGGLELFLPRNLSLSLGVQVPIGQARAFDQRVLGFFKWPF